MPRKIISKKDRIDELNEIIDSEKYPEIDPNKMAAEIREKAAGSISAVMCKTDEHNKWLKTLQDKNPFIGKDYIAKAPEYETEDRFLTPAEVSEMDNELLKSLDDGTKEYNPSSDNGEIVEELVSKTAYSDSDSKFIDHCIAAKMTNTLIGRSVDEITEQVRDELKKYHNNPEYETKINIEKSINYTTINNRISHQQNKMIK